MTHHCSRCGNFWDCKPYWASEEKWGVCKTPYKWPCPSCDKEREENESRAPTDPSQA